MATLTSISERVDRNNHDIITEQPFANNVLAKENDVGEIEHDHVFVEIEQDQSDDVSTQRKQKEVETVTFGDVHIQTRDRAVGTDVFEDTPIQTKEIEVGTASNDNVKFSLGDSDDEEESLKTLATRLSDSAIQTKYLRNLNGTRHKGRRSGVLKKHFSAPELSPRRRLSISHFVNAAFENDDFEANLSFSDVVNKLIREPIKEDIHPYGRGNLYRSAFDGAQPKIHQDESKLFLWAVTTVVILGIAGAVIFMSYMYRPEEYPKDNIVVSTINTTSIT